MHRCGWRLLGKVGKRRSNLALTEDCVLQQKRKKGRKGLTKRGRCSGQLAATFQAVCNLMVPQRDVCQPLHSPAPHSSLSSPSCLMGKGLSSFPLQRVWGMRLKNAHSALALAASSDATGIVMAAATNPFHWKVHWTQQLSLSSPEQGEVKELI